MFLQVESLAVFANHFCFVKVFFKLPRVFRLMSATVLAVLLLTKKWKITGDKNLQGNRPPRSSRIRTGGSKLQRFHSIM